MRKHFGIFAALAIVWLTMGAAACGPTVNPGPNPACASAATAIGTANQGLGIAQTAWSIGAVFVTNPTVRLAITAALDGASSSLAQAQTSILAGNCDVSSYVNAAAKGIQAALKDIADARSHAPTALAQNAGPDALGVLIGAGNDKAEAAKAAVAK